MNEFWHGTGEEQQVHAATPPVPWPVLGWRSCLACSVPHSGGWLLCHGLQDHGVLSCRGWECAFADSHAADRWAAHVSWCFAVRLAAAGSDRI